MKINKPQHILSMKQPPMKYKVLIITLYVFKVGSYSIIASLVID